MNAANIKRWIASLGMTHSEMLSKSIISDSKVFELFPGDDEFYTEPEIGLGMSFAADTGRFHSLHITLLTTTPSTVEYTGELPEPYSLRMNRSDIHTFLGEPLEYSGPLIMPEPRGQTGGWESYQPHPEIHPDVKVYFQYLESMEVNAIAFTLIDKDRD